MDNNVQNYNVIELDTWPRAEMFRHFAQGAKCSVSMTKRVDVTRLYEYSKSTGTRFYLNFLYVLSAALNTRPEYRMYWDWEHERLLCYDKINPMQYVFHPETETYSVVYTEYDDDYGTFYRRAEDDLERGKSMTSFDLHAPGHPNWFDASCIPWIDYDSLNVELPDGYLYLAPIVNWGKYVREGERLLMPLTVRMNHAIADGYLISQVFLTVRRLADGL